MSSPLALLGIQCREVDLSALNQRDGAVYFLVDDDTIVYIGKTEVIEQRLALHMIDRRWPNRRAAAHRGNDNAILLSLGLRPHDDEYENAKDWKRSLRRPERLLRFRRQIWQSVTRLLKKSAHKNTVSADDSSRCVSVHAGRNRTQLQTGTEG